MKVAVAYLRVSTTDQEKTRQYTAIKEFIQQNEFTIAEEDYYAEDLSGMLPAKDRPQLNKLLKDVVDRSVKYVIVQEISRFGRRTSDVLTNVDYLTARGICLISLTPRLWTLDANFKEDFNTKYVLSIGALFGESERAITRERFAGGKKAKTAQGFYMGSSNNVPYGYDWGDKGKLTINEGEKALVERIFKMYLSGQGTHRISEELQREGIKGKSGGSWGNNTITGILKNKRTRALIDLSIVAKADGIRTHNVNKYGINTRKSYLLTSAKWINGLNGEHLNIKDNFTKRGSVLFNKGIFIHYNAMINALYYCIRRTDVFDTFLNKLKQDSDLGNKIKQVEQTIINYNKHLVDLDEQVRKTKKMYEKSAIDDTEFDKRMDENNITRKKVKLAIPIATAELEQLIKLESEIDNETLVHKIKESDTLTKELIADVVDRLVFYPTGINWDYDVRKKVFAVRLFTNYSEEDSINYLFDNTGRFAWLHQGVSFDFEALKIIGTPLIEEVIHHFE